MIFFVWSYTETMLYIKYLIFLQAKKQIIFKNTNQTGIFLLKAIEWRSGDNKETRLVTKW